MADALKPTSLKEQPTASFYVPPPKIRIQLNDGWNLVEITVEEAIKLHDKLGYAISEARQYAEQITPIAKEEKIKHLVAISEDTNSVLMTCTCGTHFGYAPISPMSHELAEKFKVEHEAKNNE